jgi:peptide/nickel transport system substrate-binding protein
VKFNIERHKTLQGSNRRGELAPVTSVDVLDSSTVRLNLTGTLRAAAHQSSPTAPE